MKKNADFFFLFFFCAARSICQYRSRTLFHLAEEQRACVCSAAQLQEGTVYVCDMVAVRTAAPGMAPQYWAHLRQTLGDREPIRNCSTVKWVHASWCLGR